MEYKRLASTDLIVSCIGFGCWGIGGHGYGDVDDSESIRAVRKALDCGVNFFDTADVYGFGHSEEVLGKALGSQRTKVLSQVNSVWPGMKIATHTKIAAPSGLLAPWKGALDV